MTALGTIKVTGLTVTET